MNVGPGSTLPAPPPLTMLEVAREVLGPAMTDSEVEFVAWEHTGFPCFFEGDPETTFRAQLAAWKNANQPKEERMDEAEIELGERYRDRTSEFEGVAISRHEYLHGCTRVTLQMRAKDGEIKDYTFDAPALEAVSSGEPITSGKTGGPRPTPGARAGE